MVTDITSEPWHYGVVGSRHVRWPEGTQPRGVQVNSQQYERPHDHGATADAAATDRSDVISAAVLTYSMSSWRRT